MLVSYLVDAGIISVEYPMSEYVTDSTNFRVYIGTFDDENEIIKYRFSEDTLITEKYVHNEIYVSRDSLKLADWKRFNLSQLRKMGMNN